MDEYIEREAAIRKINGQFPDAHYPSWYAAQLEEIPAADVVEVVHAAWELVRMDKNDMPIYRCTNCKTKRYGRTLYCSRCGAKMDGERRSE